MFFDQTHVSGTQHTKWRTEQTGVAREDSLQGKKFRGSDPLDAYNSLKKVSKDFKCIFRLVESLESLQRAGCSDLAVIWACMAIGCGNGPNQNIMSAALLSSFKTYSFLSFRLQLPNEKRNADPFDNTGWLHVPTLL